MRNGMRRRWALWVGLSVVGMCLLCGPAWAQQGGGDDAAASEAGAAGGGASGDVADGSGAEAVESGERLRVKVTGVDGLVQVRRSEDEAWEMAKAGMELGVGASFRTGPRSAVRFKIGDSQTVTLDRLGTITVLEAIREEGKVRTEAGMEYGRSTLEVEGGGVEHETNLKSPSAMLAIRGSRGFLEEYVNRLRSGSDYGDVSWYNAEGDFIPLPPGAEQEGDDTSTAENRRREGTYIPIWLATYGPEDELFEEYVSGIFRFLERDGRLHTKERSTVERFAAPTAEGFALVEAFWGTFGEREIPGDVLTQQDLPAGASDVDLLVTTPHGERVGFGRTDADGHLSYRGVGEGFSAEIDAVSPGPGQEVSEFVGGNTALFSGGDGKVLVGTYEARMTNRGPAPADLRVLIDAATGGGGGVRLGELDFDEPLAPGETRNVLFVVPPKTPGPGN